MLRVGILPPHSLLNLYIYIRLLVLRIVERGVTQHRVAVLNMQRKSLPHQNVPQVSLPLIAGNDLPDAGNPPLRDGLDSHIVFHRFILSQPFQGCVQEPQPPRRLLRLKPGRLPLVQQMLFQ